MQPIAPPLLSWYEQNKRVLPFRTLSTPYRVWVSEIMLQQTRVSAAVPYFERFMAALPTVADLASCPQEKLHKLWEGLGYYSRVRNLQKAACIVMEEYGGQLPADYDALLKLPGIGAYTAGAIASISFGLPVPAVDGNVLRVFARLLNDDRDVLSPAVKKDLTQTVMEHQPALRPGDYNQALMELGALICLPNGAPLCEHCPLKELCLAKAAGTAEALPKKAPKPEKKQQPQTLLLVISEGRVLLEQRPPKGLLAGLWQPLLLEGQHTPQEALAHLESLGLAARFQGQLPNAKHVFTHLVWDMTLYLFSAQATPCLAGCVWADKAAIEQEYTLPNAFKACKKELAQLL